MNLNVANTTNSSPGSNMSAAIASNPASSHHRTPHIAIINTLAAELIILHTSELIAILTHQPNTTMPELSNFPNELLDGDLRNSIASTRVLQFMSLLPM